MAAHPTTLVTLGDMSRPEPALAMLGFALIAALAWRRVPGSVLLGILAATVAGLPLGLTSFQGIVSAPPDPRPTLLALDLAATLQVGFVTVVFTFFFVDLFDTAGTLIGVAHRANLLDEDGRLPRLNRALLADSSATVAGSMLGTSTVTSYIESAAGTNVGGRTGLTAVVVAGLFGLTLFFAPLAAMIPAYATSSALLVRGRPHGPRPGGDRMGRCDGVRAGRDHGDRHASHVLDSHRDRLRLHLVRRHQAA